MVEGGGGFVGGFGPSTTKPRPPSTPSSPHGPVPPPQQDGGIVIVLGMPQGSEFGIDMQMYHVGPQFRGVAGIPLGLHLLTFGTGQGLRQGFFVRITRPQEVIVKSWDPEQEELVEEGTGLPDGSMHSLLEALQRGDLNRQLGAYPEAEQGKLWRNLTNCLTEDVLRLCGLALEARVLPGDWEEEKLRSRGASTEVVPYFEGVGRTPTFTDVRGEKRPSHKPDMTPAELTHYHLDRSGRLEELLTEVYDKVGSSNAQQHPTAPWKALLGEYQLAFVLFLNLYSMGSLKHWKEMTALLCHCVQGLTQHQNLFQAFLRVFHTQVRTIPPDFFEDEVGKGSFLQPCLLRLVRNVRAEEAGKGEGKEEGFKEYVEHFAKLMEKRFVGLDLRTGREEAEEEEEEEEEDEDGPVVVPWEDVERALHPPLPVEREAQGEKLQPIQEETPA